MTGHQGAVAAYYDSNPRNERHILRDLRRDGVPLSDLSAPVLQNYDHHDHYGGHAITQQLAAETEIKPDHHVLDVGSGLGGSARYLAYHLGCDVTGLELTERRVRESKNLTALVALDHLVTFQQGDAQSMPFADGVFDVVLSQDSFLHVPDKAAAIRECHRVMKPGGRLAFTDVIRLQPLPADDMKKLGQTLVSTGFATSDEYHAWLDHCGFDLMLEIDRSRGFSEALSQVQSHREQQTLVGEHPLSKGFKFFADSAAAGRLGNRCFIARKK